MSRRKKYYYNNYDIDGIIGLIIVGGIYMTLKFIYDFVSDYYIIIILVIAVLLFFALIVFLILKRKDIYYLFVEFKENRIIKKLEKNSLLYSNIIELNKKYTFYKLEPFYDSYNVYRKSDLENCNINDYLLMTINDKKQLIDNYRNKYNKLINVYNEYETKYNDLRNFISAEEADRLKIKIDKYYECQNKIFDFYKKGNCFEFALVIYVNYSSKAGRVRDNRYKKYNLEEYTKMENEYNSLKEKTALYEISSRVERAKMSESLRYDILKRDGFKCKICGASQSDGVKLHVDHIIPVSKGGKTEPGNLQTLCSRCNIGKSNKLD